MSSEAVTPSSPRIEVADAAHDLSNACASLLGFTTLASESVQPGTPAASYLGEVMQAARTAAGIAERLRALSERLRKSENATGSAPTVLPA
jgi:signal transduction histidine kinase